MDRIPTAATKVAGDFGALTARLKPRPFKAPSYVQTAADEVDDFEAVAVFE